MDYSNNLVVACNDTEKGIFYRKVYFHLALAILAFIGVESFLLNIVPDQMILAMFQGKFIWLFLIGAFWLGSLLADRCTFSVNRSVQYLGLLFYVFLEAIIFLPMMYIAMTYSDTSVIYQAAIITLALFVGLTGVAFTSKADFSFLRNILVIGGFVALGVIVAGALFGFNLGLWFSVFMILLAGGSILYQTQKLKYTFTSGQYVGASLQLFSSVMLLYWYVLKILLDRRK